jgi:PAS domain S-box-containing protein
MPGDPDPSGGPDTSPLGEEIFRELYHAANDAIFVHNGATGEILDVNETMCEMYGYTRAEARELTVEDLSSGNPPYTQANAVEKVQNAAEGEPQVFDWRARHRDGTLFWVEVSMRRTTVDDRVLILVVVRDITERKRYEKQVEEQRDALEMLNQVVRHDIRNDMNVVRGRAKLLEDHVDEAGRDQLRVIQEATEDVIELTNTTRDLAEVMLSTREDTEPVRLERHVREPIESVRSTFDDAVITVDDPIPDVTVRGNDLLEAVFRNVLQNAIIHNDEAVPEVHVSATREDERITVAIADNGPGIPDDRKETVFGKGEKGLDSPGAGVGLYLVRTLVERYGGDVRIEDNDPKGAVFVIELPIVG